MNEDWDWLEVYTIPVKWRTIFRVRNLHTECEIDLPNMKVLPEENYSNVVLEFATDNLQRELAKEKALEMIKPFRDVATLFLSKPCIVEVSEVHCLNENDVKGKPTIKVLDGEDHYLKKILDPVELSKEESERFKSVFDALFRVRAMAVPEFDLHYALRTAVYWLGKSLQERSFLDQVISLWIPFNAIYSHVWRKDHPRKNYIYEWQKFTHFIISSGYFTADECHEIIEGHPSMVQRIIDSLQSEDYIIKRFGSREEAKKVGYRVDFQPYYRAKKWNEALAEIVHFIYGVRNSIFHGSWLPQRYDDGALQDSASILHIIVEAAIGKLLNRLSAIRKTTGNYHS